MVSGVWVLPHHFWLREWARMQEVGYAGGEDEEMWGSMGGGGVSEGEEGVEGAIPRPIKSKPPLPTTTARPTKAVPAPKPTNPPKTATTNPPPTHQDRHPQGCREEGRPSRGSDRGDGRPRTLPQRGREGHRPWYPRAEVRCRLGAIPGRHHPLRG